MWILISITKCMRECRRPLLGSFKGMCCSESKWRRRWRDFGVSLVSSQLLASKMVFISFIVNPWKYWISFYIWDRLWIAVISFQVSLIHQSKRDSTMVQNLQGKYRGTIIVAFVKVLWSFIINPRRQRLKECLIFYSMLFFFLN